TVDRQSSVYQSNYAAMQAALERLRTELKRSTEGGGEKYVRRHIERGKLLPRERVEMLLDEGADFLENAALAGIGMANESPGAGRNRDGSGVSGRGSDWRVGVGRGAGVADHRQ